MREYYHGDAVMRIIEEFKLDFLTGQVCKYILRAGNKPDNSELRDLQKAKWYLDRKIKALAPPEEVVKSTETAYVCQKCGIESDQCACSGGPYPYNAPPDTEFTPGSASPVMQWETGEVPERLNGRILLVKMKSETLSVVDWYVSDVTGLGLCVPVRTRSYVLQINQIEKWMEIKGA